MTTFDYNYQNSFRFCFVIEICQSRWGLKNNSLNLHKKTTNWRILVVVVKWRHRAIVLLARKVCRGKYRNRFRPLIGRENKGNTYYTSPGSKMIEVTWNIWTRRHAMFWNLGSNRLKSEYSAPGKTRQICRWTIFSSGTVCCTLFNLRLILRDFVHIVHLRKRRWVWKQPEVRSAQSSSSANDFILCTCGFCLHLHVSLILWQFFWVAFCIFQEERNLFFQPLSRK